MGIFNKLGDVVLKIFSLIGMLIMAIPKIPEKLRNINRDDIKEDIKNKIDTENLKENISKIREESGVEDKISKLTHKTPEEPEEHLEIPEDIEKLSKEMEGSESDVVLISSNFSPEEKEKTIFHLQILSAAFLVLSIIYIFNFISIPIYIVLGALIAGYIIYVLFKRVKLMYSHDFNAYRDFFLMYLAVGIILVLVSNNPNFVMAFSFDFFPSLTILLFAVIAVVAVFLIFRIRYYRNYTYGKVVESGKNTAYVKVEYDIRSNVKPDIYIVENSYGAVEGDTVKLKLEEKFMSMSGNKPVSIIEKVEKMF